MMSNVVCLGGVAAWLVTTLVAGCSSTSTPSPATESGTPLDASAVDATDATTADSDAADASDASVCPLPGALGSPLCESCISALCCAEVVACTDDPSCHIVLSCVQACLLKPNAGPCIEKCKSDTPAGEAKYMAFDACVAAPPPNGCGIDCSE